MLPPVYSIQFQTGGAWSEAQTFADAKITTASRRLVNQGLDTCQVTFAGARPPLLGTLATGQRVRILRDDFDGDGGASNPLGWFVGTVVAPKRAVLGNSENASLTLNGPWWFLANLVYRQMGLFYVPAGTITLGGDTVVNTTNGPEVNFGKVKVEISTAPIVLLSSDIILTQAQSEGVPMDAADTLADALGYCLGKRQDAFTVGDVPQDISIPSEQATDPTCADMVKKVLRWLPSVVSWFDYTQDPPKLNFTGRADRAPLTYAMGGQAPQVSAATIQARPDLVLPGVTLQFLRRFSLTTTTGTATTTTPAATTGTGTTTPAAPTSTTVYGTGAALANPSNNSGYIATTKPANSTTTDPATGATTSTTTTSESTEINCLEIDKAGPEPDGIGALVCTVQLQGGTVNTPDSGVNTTPFEPTPLGLAAFIYAARSVLSYEGSVTLKGQDLLSGKENLLGRTLNILGGDVDWQTMAAEIQTVSENTATGETSLTVGPPNHLGPSDLAALLQANRLRSYVELGTSLLRNTGGAALPPASPLPATPPSAPPTGGPGNNGGHTGPSTAPDGGTIVTSGFAGILDLYSGTNRIDTPNDGVRADSNGFHAANCAGYGSAPQEKLQPGQGSAFVAERDASATCTPSYTTDGSQAIWSTTVNNGASHTEGNLDLTAFTAFSFEYAELRGSIEATDADTGNAHTTDYSEDCTARLGTASFYRVYAGTPAKYYHDAGNGYNAAQGYSKITITGLYLVRRKG